MARGESPKEFWAKSYEYNQSHKPVREQNKVVGHAVRAMYMFSAMADLAAELGRRQPEARLRGAVGRRHGLEDLHHLRARAARPRTKASPKTTTCPTTPPMPRPAPRWR